MIDPIRTRLLRAPSEGWISLFLVATMAVAVAWSLDDSALVLGQRAWTDFLAWASLAGVGVGFLGARIGWSRPLAHLAGALVAALVVPWMVGGILAPDGSPAVRFAATATACLNAVVDLVSRGLPVTRESGHYLLVLGLVCWANGQFAAAAVFRHGRPIGPIIVLGAILVANMSATVHDQLWFIVLFTMASLLLLTRLHALDERATWLRRRIGDPAAVGSLYLRGGTVFIMIAVLGSLTLTASARSKPLEGMWDDAKPLLVDISQWLQRIVPAAPDSKSLGVPSFGAQVTIGGIWSTSKDPALTIHRPAGDGTKYYWRATAYDSFTLNGWTTASPTREARDSGANLLAGTLDRIPDGTVRTDVTFNVTPRSRLFKVAFSPIDPKSIDRPVTLNLGGVDGFFQSIEIGAGDSYSVVSALPARVDLPGGLTQNRLRAAGTDYPPGIAARYLGVPDGAMGNEAKKLLADIKAKVKAAGHNDPFDLAEAIVAELQSSRYTYRTDVLGVCNDAPSIVECFAAHKVGYCEHYASTMTILLRAAGYPSRLVEGFLPGTIDPTTGTEEILMSGAHAWVEVYFPGFGWQMFDPTGISQALALPEGEVVPLATPRPSPSFGFASGDPRDGPDQPSRRPGAVVPGGANSGNNQALIVVAIILFLAVLLVAFLAWRRGPRSASTPDGVYASIVSLARRFGFGPRPTQTAYEYATALGDILPNVRPELQTVATAKVEVAYGRRSLGDDRLRTLRDSYRRLRVQLLRLALRRRDRRRMR
ncbi:MAG TPA: transglutaminase domain-containing protein [Candidatus Limnocylindrales bacterium]|nr:transglutaminase domain-containing protein [Candidatus Limnocylindrales bacterium]